MREPGHPIGVAEPVTRSTGAIGPFTGVTHQATRPLATTTIVRRARW